MTATMDTILAKLAEIEEEYRVPIYAQNLIAALKRAVDGLRHYSGRRVEISDGYCRLRYTPEEDAPSMCFYKDETWLLGDRAEEALAEIADMLGKGDVS